MPDALLDGAQQNLNQTVSNRQIWEEHKTRGLAAFQESQARRLDLINRLGISLTPRQFEFLSAQRENGALDDDTLYNMASAWKIGEMFGIPRGDAYENLDAVRHALFRDEKQYQSPKGFWQGVGDSWRIGRNTPKMALLGTRLSAAEAAGNGEEAERLWEEVRRLTEENQDLASFMPQGKWWGSRLLNGIVFTGLQSAPGTLKGLAAGAGGAVLGAAGGAAIGAVTGAGAGLLAVKGAQLIGNFAAFAASAQEMQGLLYITLRESGANHDTALGLSITGGALEGAVEVALGDIASFIGGGAKNISKTVINESARKAVAAAAGKNLVKKLANNSLAASIGGKVAWDQAKRMFGEGAEEGIQQLVDEAMLSLAAALQDEYVDAHTIGEIVAGAAESARGGFLGSVLLLAPGAVLSGRAAVREAAAIRYLAETSPSEEAFKAGAAKIKDQDGNPVIKPGDAGAVYAAAARARERALNPVTEDVKETLYTGRDAEKFEESAERDEEGNAVTKMSPYRQNGRLYTELEEARAEGGTIRGTMKAGNPALPKASNVYGAINFTDDGETVRITGFRMAELREGLREEFYKEFAEQFAGREIVWNPQNETARAVKEQLISNNAFGTGLNYYPGRAEAAETRVSERQVKRLERYLPGLQAQERPVALALAGQLAKSLNKTADEFLDGFEMTGELPGEYAAQAAGKQVKGAAFFRELAGDVKAVMYVSENADFSTWAHELTHIYRRMLRGDLLAGLEKALGVEGGDWTERAWQDKNGELKNHDEQLAELVEDYLTEGKAPAPGLRGLFEKIADFMRAIYRALRNGDRLTPEIRAVLDRIFSGEAGQNRQDADTVKSEADAEMRQRFQESPYGERLNERINELNREGRERAMEIAREEGTTGTTVEGPLLQVDIKNGDNLQAEKSYYKANVQRNVEWLLNAEPVAVISENAINIDSLEGKNFVDKIYNLFVQNKTTQVMRGDWKINLSKSGIRASRQKGLSTSKINAFAALPEIITQGIITDVNRNWKNRGYDSYFINAPLKIGDGEYIAEVIINHGKDGIGNFYLHEVEEKSKLRGVKQTGMDTRTPEGASKLNIAHLLVESNTENENPSILFQLTEKEIQEEARRYSSPQAWKEADETGALMGITPVLPGDLTGEAAGAWYQAKWEEAHRGAETQGTETAPEAGNAEAIDQAFIQNEVQPAGKLEAFLKEVNRIDMTEAWQPEDEREQLAVDRHIYLQDRIRRELRHGVWLSNAKRAARGTPLTEATRKRMISLIKAAPRDYRSLWAEAMNLPEYEVSSEDTGKAALGSLLGSPDERFAKAVSPEQIRKLARDIQDEDIRKAVESGEIKIDDPKADRYVRLLRGDLRKLAKQLKQLKERTDADLRDISDPIVRKLLKQYDELNALRLAAAEAEAGMQRQLRNRIKVTEKYQQEAFQKRHDAIALQEQIENALANAEASAEAREAIARKETEYKIRAKYQKKLREQRNLAKIRELKKRIARVTQQKISYDTVYHEQAKKIIVLQQWTLPLMQKGINRWLGTEGSILKSIYDQFNGDEHFRDKIRRSLAKQKKDKAGISTGELYARGQNVFNKITEIMGKNYEGMTRQDRLYLREKLPMKQLIERDEIILKHFFTSYKIDEEFRENAGNFIPEDMAKKQYEDLSSDEKMFIAAGIQDEDWRAKLGWYGLFDERKGYIPLDIREKRDNFGDVEEARPGEEEYALMRDSLPAALFRRIQERPYADWTIEEAAELAEVVNDWKAEGKAILAERREIERRLIDKYQDEILKTVRTAGKARGADAEKLKKILGKYDRGMIGAENSRIKELPFKYAVENGRRLFRFMDGDRNGGIFSTLLIWLEDEAFNEEMRNRYRRMDKMDKVMKDAGIEALELYTNKFTLANLYGDGRDIEISLDKALHIREAGKNERSKQAVMYGNLLLPGERAQAQALDDITAFADRARGRYERIVTEANQFLDQNRKFLKLTGAIAEDYDQQYPRMNRVSLDRYNAPVFKEENYTPIGRLQGTGDIHESKLAAEAKRAAGAGLLAYADKGTFKSRINIGLAHQAPIKLGLYETWVENVEETEHAMAIAQYEKILNTVFKGRGPRAQEIRLAIANRYGKEGMKYIDNYINDIISPESPEAQGIIRYLRGNTAAAYLAFRVRSLVTQAITSPAPFFQYMNPAEYAQAAAELAGNYTVLSDFIKKESVFMRSRQGSLAIASVKEMTEKADNPRRAKYNELIKTGMNGLELVDWTCVAPGWLAVYWRELGRITAENANLKEDTALSTEEIRAEAVRLADDVVRLTQPSSRKVDLAPLFKSNNEFFRAFLQFQGSLNVIFQNVFIDTPYFMRTRQYEKVTGGLLAYAASSLVLGAVLTGSGGEDKEPDEQAKQAVFFALAQFSDSIPVAGSAATAILERMITGKGGYQSPNNLLPVLDKTSLALSAAAQAIYEEDQKKRKKATLRAAGQAAEAAGIFGGFPVSALKDIGKALDIGDGDGQLGFHPEALIGRQVKKE